MSAPAPQREEDHEMRDAAVMEVLEAIGAGIDAIRDDFANGIKTKTSRMTRECCRERSTDKGDQSGRPE